MPTPSKRISETDVVVLQQRVAALENQVSKLLLRQLKVEYSPGAWQQHAELVQKTTKVFSHYTSDGRVQLSSLAIQTPRLMIQPVTRQDTAFIQHICQEVADHDFGGDKEALTLEQVPSQVARWSELWRQNIPTSALIVMQKRYYQGQMSLAPMGLIIINDKQEVSFLLRKQAWQRNYLLEIGVALFHVCIPLLQSIYPFPKSAFMVKCRLDCPGLQVILDRLGFHALALDTQQDQTWIYFGLALQQLEKVQPSRLIKQPIRIMFHHPQKNSDVEHSQQDKMRIPQPKAL